MGAIREQLKAMPLVLAFILIGLGFTFAPSITSGVIAAVLFALGLLCVVYDRRLGLLGQRVEGVVVDHKEEEDCFVPVIEFQDRDGRTRREATNSGGGLRKPPVGSPVVVIYDPTGKGGCEIDRFWRRSGPAIAFCIFGVIFVIGALLSR